MTHLTPQALMARGACSREEPQPKLAPATMMSPGSTVEAKLVSMSSIQWEARDFCIGGVEIPGGNDYVGIHVVAVFVNLHCLTPPSELAGFATQPATADAAATAGLARIHSELTGPMRPTKLRLVVEMARSPSESTPMWPPRQGPQVGVDTAQPASIKVWMQPLCHGVQGDLLGGGDDDAAHCRRPLCGP